MVVFLLEECAPALIPPEKAPLTFAAADDTVSCVVFMALEAVSVTPPDCCWVTSLEDIVEARVRSERIPGACKGTCSSGDDVYARP